MPTAREVYIANECYSDRTGSGNGNGSTKNRPVGASSYEDEDRVSPPPGAILPFLWKMENEFVALAANSMDLFNSYETEIRILRHELESRGVQTIPTHIGAPAQHAGPSQAPPPALGHGPSNLFGGIMANQGGSGPGLAPPPPQDQQPPQHTLQQPIAAAQQGAAPPPQGSFGGYQPGAAVNGMCDFGFHWFFGV